MPERVLIETCSPTLAGMKPANLISLPYQNEEQARADIREMNRIFAGKGLPALSELHKGLSSLMGVWEKPGGADGSRSFVVKISFS